MLLYHGSSETVEFPEIRKARFNKDFYFGFYCTQYREQAVRWASRYGKTGFINTYEYTPDPGLNYLVFEEMTEEWLDFIVSSRRGSPTPMILWKGPWQMIRSIIIFRILWTERYPEPHSGSLPGLNTRLIRSVSIRCRRWIRCNL